MQPVLVWLHSFFILHQKKESALRKQPFYMGVFACLYAAWSGSAHATHGRLVTCISIWLVPSRAEIGAQPGSRETKLDLVSPEPGSLAAGPWEPASREPSQALPRREPNTPYNIDYRHGRHNEFNIRTKSRMLMGQSSVGKKLTFWTVTLIDDRTAWLCTARATSIWLCTHPVWILDELGNMPMCCYGRCKIVVQHTIFSTWGIKITEMMLSLS